MQSCTPYQNHHLYLMVVTGSQWNKICWACEVKLISNIKYSLCMYLVTEYCSLIVTRSAKIDHVSAKKSPIFSVLAVS